MARAQLGDGVYSVLVKTSSQVADGQYAGLSVEALVKEL